MPKVEGSNDSGAPQKTIAEKTHIREEQSLIKTITHALPFVQRFDQEAVIDNMQHLLSTLWGAPHYSGVQLQIEDQQKIVTVTIRNGIRVYRASLTVNQETHTQELKITQKHLLDDQEDEVISLQTGDNNESRMHTNPGVKQKRIAELVSLGTQALQLGVEDLTSVYRENQGITFEEFQQTPIPEVFFGVSETSMSYDALAVSLQPPEKLPRSAIVSQEVANFLDVAMNIAQGKTSAEIDKNVNYDWLSAAYNHELSGYLTARSGRILPPAGYRKHKLRGDIAKRNLFGLGRNSGSMAVADMKSATQYKLAKQHTYLNSVAQQRTTVFSQDLDGTTFDHEPASADFHTHPFDTDDGFKQFIDEEGIHPQSPIHEQKLRAAYARFFDSNLPSDNDTHRLAQKSSIGAYSSFVITPDVVYLLLPTLDTKYVTSGIDSGQLGETYAKSVSEKLSTLMQNITESTEDQKIFDAVDSLIKDQIRKTALRLGVAVYAGERKRNDNNSLSLSKIA